MYRSLLHMLMLVVYACVCACETRSCNDAYSCAFNDEISDNTECGGYCSCAFSKSMIVNTNSSCNGAFSCLNSSSISIDADKTSNDPITIKLYCNGLFSCASNKNITL